MQIQRNFHLSWLLIALLITSCSKDSASSATASVPVTSSDNESETDGQVKRTATITAPTPDGKSILADIYKKPIREGTDNQLSDGRYVSYWNGHQFTFDGKNYFVAFSEATSESEIEYPAPEDKVTISQATYEFSGTEWKLKTVQHDVGKFGGKNKAPTVNSDQKNMTSPEAGKLMLATPTFISAMSGTQLYFYEIFSFSPSDTQWKYLGYVASGHDNSAGCAHEADSAIKTKCVKSTGILKFTTVENSVWPELKVVLHGTELGEGGNVVTLTDKNSVTYRYDDKSSTYQITH